MEVKVAIFQTWGGRCTLEESWGVEEALGKVGMASWGMVGSLEVAAVA